MAAGLGFKNFVTGDVLTAAETNGYLMQGVWVFANAAARTAAVTSPQQGNASFLKDTNALEIYNGAAWVAYGSGDITGVTAGTGISGGGTSGDVTITNSMATAIDAKGDLIAGTGADAFSRLAVGSNDQYLVADSTTATGLKWATLSAGAYTQIATGTLSSTVVNITTIPATYQALRLVIRQHRPATDNRGINLYFNADTNTRYDSQAAFSADSVVFSGSSFVIGAANDDTVATGLTVVDIPDYYNTTTWKMCQTMSIAVNPSTTTNYNWRFQFGVYNQTAAISQLNILGGTGSSFTSGTYILYGIK